MPPCLQHPNLTLLPVYDTATTVARDAIKDDYKKPMDTDVDAHAFKNHMMVLIIKAVPNIYIYEFDDAMMGYATATPEQMDPPGQLL
jgi:hypothetical protein